MNQLEQAYRKRDYETIKKIILSGDNSFIEINSFDQNQIVKSLLVQKMFDAVLKVSATFNVCMDVFELEQLEHSFLDTVISNCPFYSQPITGFNYQKLSKEEPNSEALSFFKAFVSLIENIDETVGKNSIIRTALNKKLPTSAIEILLDAGCNVNEIDASENTLLHLPLTTEQLNLLIQKGANVNQKNRGDISPLENAIDRNDAEAVKILLDNGADINVHTKDGNSMFYKALVQKQAFELYDLLCEYGFPNFNERNNNNSILLYDFIRSIDKYSSTISYDYLQKILGQGASISATCLWYNNETTPLDLAISKHYKVFEIVMENYLDDINITDNNGNTLLHKLCAVNLNFEADKAKELYKKVKLVLAKGANKNIRNSEDKLPQELALDDNLKEKIVTLLLK